MARVIASRPAAASGTASPNPLPTLPDPPDIPHQTPTTRYTSSPARRYRFSPPFTQALLDKLLYDTDRAIDLYALGFEPDGTGEPEWRAAAYGALMLAFMRTESGLDFTARGTVVRDPDGCLAGECLTPRVELPGTQGTAPELAVVILQIAALLGQDKLVAGTGAPVPPPVAPAEANARAELLRMAVDELCLQRLSDRRLGELVETMAAGCTDAVQVIERLSALVDAAIDPIQKALTGTAHPGCVDPEIVPPPTTESSLELFNRVHQQMRGP
jgi:hypothetical protein